MKTTFTAAILLLLGFTQSTKACDCLFINNFCEAITFGNNGQIPDYLNVYRVKVTATATNGVKVFVGETYAGENKTGQNLFIEDGNGANCVLFASTNLNLNSTYIIAAVVSGGDTLTMSECAVTFLEVVDGQVVGAIAPGVSSVVLEDFSSIANCGDLTPVDVFIPDAKDKLIVTPTLATDMVTVKMNQTFRDGPNELEVVVYDAAGALVYSGKYADFSYYSSAFIDTRFWSAGVYLMKLQTGVIRETVRIVKID